MIFTLKLLWYYIINYIFIYIFIFIYYWSYLISNISMYVPIHYHLYSFVFVSFLHSFEFTSFSNQQCLRGFCRQLLSFWLAQVVSEKFLIWNGVRWAKQLHVELETSDVDDIHMWGCISLNFDLLCWVRGAVMSSSRVGLGLWRTSPNKWQQQKASQ